MTTATNGGRCHNNTASEKVKEAQMIQHIVFIINSLRILRAEQIKEQWG